MKLKISLILMAINIVILILDFIFVDKMATWLLYTGLVWIMVSTPILLYLAMRGVRDGIKNAK